MPFTIFLTNTPNTNTTVNTLGNQVTIQLNPPISLNNKKNYILRVLSSQILYCFSNVFTGKNDKIHFSYSSSNTHYIITLPQGLYSIDGINEEVSRQTNDLIGNQNLFFFVGDSANSSVYIYFNDATLKIYCAFSDSVLPSLGFPYSADVIGPYPAGSQVSLGNPAKLNSVSSINMTCDACGGGIYQNGNSSSVVASILINSDPFNNIDYQPINPPKLKISKYMLDNINFTLLDQSLNMIDMNSNSGTQNYEPWSAVIEIDEYDITTGRII